MGTACLTHSFGKLNLKCGSATDQSLCRAAEAHHYSTICQSHFQQSNSSDNIEETLPVYLFQREWQHFATFLHTDKSLTLLISASTSHQMPRSHVLQVVNQCMIARFKSKHLSNGGNKSETKTTQMRLGD